MASRSWSRDVPQLLVGLVALAVAVAIALPVTAVVVAGALRDVKRQRDTIVVTGSAKQPIEANLAVWRLSVSAQERTPRAAIAAVRAKIQRVDGFLERGGVGGSAINKPPIAVEQTSVNVPTGLKKPAFRAVPAWRVGQSFTIQTAEINTVERVAARVGDLLAQGTDVTVEPIQYLSTRLKRAKFAALRLATADARERAETIADGLGGDLGSVKSVQLGVYQITPRNSTDVSDYGINDTSTRRKDVTAVVTVTFRVER